MASNMLNALDAAFRFAFRPVVNGSYTRQIRDRGGVNAFRYLFVVGHTRSGSTLLTNILCSHPEFRGFGEVHRAYRDEQDLDFLIRRVHFAHRSLALTDGYVLDKILHDKHTPNPEAIDLPTARYIVPLRDPIKSTKSWLDTFGGTEEDAVNYLDNRLNSLADLTERYSTGDRCRWFTYEDMLESGPTMLAQISEFLKLETPLSESYKRQPRADVLGTGDPSQRQQAGKIIKEQRQHKRDISDASKDRLNAAYEAAKERIARACTRIEAG